MKFCGAHRTRPDSRSQPPSRHRGSAVGDLNGDGKLDVVVSAINAPAEVWMNDSPGNNHWLEIKLQGTKSNRDGIGARIKVVTKSGAQYNHMSTSFGYASSSAGPVHFGLGRVQPLTWSRFAGLRESCSNCATWRWTEFLR